MAKKIKKGNRIVTVLDKAEKEKKKEKKNKGNPTNRDIMDMLEIILDAVTEDDGEGRMMERGGD